MFSEADWGVCRGLKVDAGDPIPVTVQVVTEALTGASYLELCLKNDTDPKRRNLLARVRIPRLQVSKVIGVISAVASECRFQEAARHTRTRPL
jgi:hypothetical protein